MLRIDLEEPAVRALVAEVGQLPAFGARFPTLVMFAADLQKTLTGPVVPQEGCCAPGDHGKDRHK